jgi:hypothetical protein
LSAHTVDEAVEWLWEVLVHMRSGIASIGGVRSGKYGKLLSVRNYTRYTEKLRREHFAPWLNARKYMNKVYFTSINGLEVIMNIYETLHQQPENEHTLRLESRIINVLWSLCETSSLRRSIVEAGGLTLCIKSLLREKLQWEQSQNSRSSSTLVHSAAGLLSK